MPCRCTEEQEHLVGVILIVLILVILIIIMMLLGRIPSPMTLGPAECILVLHFGVLNAMNWILTDTFISLRVKDANEMFAETK